MIKIDVDATHRVSGLAQVPETATACLVLAHGAGAGMTHPFMAAVANGLFERGIATLRYQFPYMESGSRRPDRPVLAQATVRAAIEAARQVMPTLPLFAGGKSFGGRMTSQAQAVATMRDVHGIVFLGFPLHLAKAPAVERAQHLASIDIPMLFVQGTRDALAEIGLIEATVAKLASATLSVVDGADHSFHVPVKSGRKDAQVLDAMLDELAAWVGRIVATVPVH